MPLQSILLRGDAKLEAAAGDTPGSPRRHVDIEAKVRDVTERREGQRPAGHQ